MQRVLAAFTVTTVPACVTACQPRLPDPNAPAWIDGSPVTAADVRERFAAGPADVRSRARRPGGRRYLLQLTIDDALLYREAQRRGLRPSFSDLEPTHGRWMRRYLDAELEPGIRLEDVPEDDVRAEYDRVHADLVSPPRADVEVVAYGTEEAALQVLAEVRAATDPRVDGVLGRIVRDAAQTAVGRPLTGINGLFTAEEMVRYLGPEAEAAVTSMSDEETVYPGLVPFRGGHGILVVKTRFPARDVPYEDAAPQIRQRLLGERREAALDRLAQSLRARTAVVVDESAFELVPWTDRGAPPRADAGPALSPP